MNDVSILLTDKHEIAPLHDIIQIRCDQVIQHSHKVIRAAMALLRFVFPIAGLACDG
jgi:hypothetical protein